MKNKLKVHRIVLKILLALVIVGVAGVMVYVGMTVSGKNKLYKKSANKKPDLASVATDWVEKEAEDSGEEIKEPVVVIPPEEEFDNWEEGDIRYKGVHYRYNDQILTFLFLGIDKDSTVKAAKNEKDGGQSDAIFLLTLNPKTKELSLIGVNRDTMTDVDVYSETGEFLMTVKEQITLQHAYGDGKETSCERSVKAVSRLFYNMPIHGYCAINLGAIPKINDAVGGVDLVALEDVLSGNKVVFKKGQSVHLSGKMATTYLQARDCDSFESASRRTDRQKQYLLAYADTAKKAIKKDATLVVSLYNTISKYMVTDVSADEVAYLSSMASDYRLDADHVYSLKGKTKEGEKFEEFYADEKAMYELTLKVFYDVIDD